MESTENLWEKEMKHEREREKAKSLMWNLGWLYIYS